MYCSNPYSSDQVFRFHSSLPFLLASCYFMSKTLRSIILQSSNPTCMYVCVNLESVCLGRCVGSIKGNSIDSTVMIY